MEDILVRKILQDINIAKNNFADVENRKIFLYHFRENVNTLYDLVSGFDYSKNLVIALIDSLKNLKAESIDNKKLDIMKDIIEVISRGNVTGEELEYHIEVLIENDIMSVRLPANISDFYH